ncbi:MAG: hypothetical protein HON77_10400 [Gammaproteobacteria bacterium]|jgi:hypothetical protein|nr:hypothetical protein [Candidatus Latescibacterota bacterium]MBT6584704.1 hypothetical protein [Gammaproteobacteria bacterium]
MSHSEVPGAWVSLPDLEAGPMARLISAHPRIGPVLDRLVETVMYQAEYLNRRECEMIAAISAAAQDCHY